MLTSQSEQRDVAHAVTSFVMCFLSGDVNPLHKFQQFQLSFFPRSLSKDPLCTLRMVSLASVRVNGAQQLNNHYPALLTTMTSYYWRVNLSSYCSCC